MKYFALLVITLLVCAASASITWSGVPGINRLGNTALLVSGDDYAEVYGLKLGGSFTIQTYVRVGIQSSTNGGTLFYSSAAGNVVELAINNTGANPAVRFSVQFTDSSVSPAVKRSAQIVYQVDVPTAQWFQLSAGVRPVGDNQAELCIGWTVTDVVQCQTFSDWSPNNYVPQIQEVTYLARGATAASYLVGGLDDFLLWGYPMSDIALSTVNVLSAQDERLTAFWRFDEGCRSAATANSFGIAFDSAADFDARLVWGPDGVGSLYQPLKLPASVSKRDDVAFIAHEEERCMAMAENMEQFKRCGGGGAGTTSTAYWIPKCSWSGDPHYYTPENGNFDQMTGGWQVQIGYTPGGRQLKFAVLLYKNYCGGPSVTCGETLGFLNFNDNGQQVWGIVGAGSVQGYLGGLRTWPISQTAVYYPELGVSLWADGNGQNVLAPSRFHFYGSGGNPTVLIHGSIGNSWYGNCRNCRIDVPNCLLENPLPRTDCYYGRASYYTSDNGCPSMDCPQVTCPCRYACASTPPANCVFNTGGIARDAWGCVPESNTCGALLNSRPCAVPDTNCEYRNPVLAVASQPCQSCCGTLTSKLSCQSPHPLCVYQGPTYVQAPASEAACQAGGDPLGCKNNCGTLVTTLDCAAAVTCDGGWFDSPQTYTGSSCVINCGTLRCPCNQFTIEKDCTPLPGCEYTNPKPETNPRSPYFRLPPAQPCVTCGKPSIIGLNCTEPVNCAYTNTKFRDDLCITDCGALVSALKCVPPPNCAFDKPYLEKGCLSNCGPLTTTFDTQPDGTCTPPQYCKYTSTVWTYDDEEKSQQCITDCGRPVTGLTCNPQAAAAALGLDPTGCHYVEEVFTQGIDPQTKREYRCTGNCGRLVCPCPELGDCAPPANCKYTGVTYYTSGPYSRTAADLPATNCPQVCGTLDCLPPVDPPTCAACDAVDIAGLQAQISECRGADYLDCSNQLCLDPKYISQTPVNGTSGAFACFYDRCVLGTFTAGLDMARLTLEQCQATLGVDPTTCWDACACPNFCGGPCAGSCNSATGQCDCKPGFKGVDCSVAEDSYCYSASIGLLAAASPAVSQNYDVIARSAVSVLDFVRGNPLVCPVDGQCQVAQSVVPAPALPGGLTTWIYKEVDLTNQALGVYSFGLQVTAATGLKAASTLTGTVRLYSADNADFSRVTAFKIVNPAASVAADATAARIVAQANTVAIDSTGSGEFAFTLQWSAGSTVGFVLSGLPLDVTTSGCAQVSFDTQQKHNLDTLYTVNGVENSDCATAIQGSDIASLADATVAGQSTFKLCSGQCNTQCQGFTDCSSCQAAPGCGWCADAEECLSGDASGPSQVSNAASCSEWRFPRSANAKKRNSRQADDLAARVVANVLATDSSPVITKRLDVVLPPGQALAVPALVTLPCAMAEYTYEITMLIDLNQASAALVKSIGSTLEATLKGIRVALQPTRYDVRLTLVSFSDKPVLPFGTPAVDYVFKMVSGSTQLDDDGVRSLVQLVRSLQVLQGGAATDVLRGAQLEAMVQAALQVSTALPPNTARYFVVLTSTGFHLPLLAADLGSDSRSPVAGLDRTQTVNDFKLAVLAAEADVISTPYPYERGVSLPSVDYPSTDSVMALLLNRQITPIFVLAPLTATDSQGLVALYTDLVDNRWGFGHVFTVRSDWSNLATVVPSALLYARNSLQLVRDSQTGPLFSSAIKLAEVNNLVPGTTVKVWFTLARAASKRSIDEIFTEAFTVSVVGLGNIPVRVAADDLPVASPGHSLDVSLSYLRDTVAILPRTVRLVRGRSQYSDANPATLRIVTLPTNGKLFQFASELVTGVQIAAGDIVTDTALTRVVYLANTLSTGGGYFGADSFTYVSADTCGYDSAVGTVSIDIKYFNYPPICQACSLSMLEDGTDPVTLQASNVDTPTLEQTFTILPTSHAIFNTQGGAITATTPSNVWTVTPAKYNWGTYQFDYEASDPADASRAPAGATDVPAFSGSCPCAVTIDHVNHCPIPADQSIKTGLNGDGNQGNVTVQLQLVDVDSQDGQQVFLNRAQPAFTSGKLYQCQLATNGVVADDLDTYCLPGSLIVFGGAADIEVPKQDGVFRVVYVPATGASGANIDRFTYYATDVPTAEANAPSYRAACSSTCTPNANVEPSLTGPPVCIAGGQSTVSLSVDTVLYPAPPLPTKWRSEGWEDIPTIVTFTSRSDATNTFWQAFIVASVPASAGSCAQMDGTAIAASPATPVLVTDSQHRIQCTWTKATHGDPNSSPDQYAYSTLTYLLQSYAGNVASGSVQYTFKAIMQLFVWPINHAPLALAQSTVPLFETPDAQFNAQPFTAITLRATDIDVDPTQNTLQFIIVALPTLGQLYQPDGVTLIAAGQAVTATGVSPASATILYQGNYLTYGADQFSFKVSDGHPCGATAGRPASPCTGAGAAKTCQIYAAEADGCSADQIVTLAITHVNHPPFAVLNRSMACENQEQILCVSGYDVDVGDVLNSAQIQALPSGGQLFALSVTGGKDSRTLLTDSMLPFTVDAQSNINAVAGVVGCIAYMPPTDQFGLALDDLVFTVDDAQPLNHQSAPLTTPIDVYVVLEPPYVPMQTVVGQADDYLPIQLAFSDVYTTNRTYITKVKVFPTHGVLLNADESPIAANGYLSNPFKAIFVPIFAEYGSPYDTFTIEVFDVALIGITSAQFQTIEFGNSTNLGVCTIFRPTTGDVPIIVTIPKKNHYPTLEVSSFTGMQNTLLNVTLVFDDVDTPADTLTLFVRTLPASGYLYQVAPPAVPATCGAQPDFAVSTAIASTMLAITPDAGTTNQFTFFYYAPLNAAGQDYASFDVIAYDQPITADTATQLASYPVSAVSLSLAPVNQPPAIQFSANGEFVYIAGDQTATVSSTKSNGRISKALQFLISDADVGTGLLDLSVSTNQGKLTLTGFVGDAVSTYSFTGLGMDQINNLLSLVQLDVSNAQNDPPITVTVSVNDRGQFGAVNPRCNSNITSGSVIVKANADNRAIVAGAAASGAIAAVLIATAGGAAALGVAWVAAHRTNALDAGSAPFGDDLTDGITNSPAYSAGALEMGNPVWAAKEDVGGH
jgi:hypothetical protein